MSDPAKAHFQEMEVSMTMVDVFGRETFNVPKVFLEEPIRVKPHTRRPAVRRRHAVQHDAALAGVLALIEGLRAGQHQLEQLGWQGRQARIAARAALRQERWTKATAFVLFVLMAGAMGFLLWAGVQGGG